MPRIPAVALAGSLALCIAIPVRAEAPSTGLSAREQRIATAADAGKEDAIALLAKLVDRNSGSFNSAGVKAVADLLVPEFERLGFETQWKPMAAAGRAGHLVAVHRGNGSGKRILLIGHLDTVFEADDPFTGFRRDGDEAVGPGVGDDKGGVVVILAALRALQAADALRDADIEVVLSGDEEDVGTPVSIARADLVAAGKRADVALDFENLSHRRGRDMGSIARRSSNTWVLATRGESGHSSGIFSESTGDGAIFELARIIAAFRTELPEPNLTFNVGLVGGGQTAALDAGKTRVAASGKDNIVPPVAVARGDFRTLDVEQTRRVAAKMQAIVARHLPMTGATLQIDQNYPPMPPTAGNRALLARLNGVNRDMGLPAMGELDPSGRGAGDIAFVAADTDGLVGMGIAADGSHVAGESADLGSIPRQATRAAILMHRLANAPR